MQIKPFPKFKNIYPLVIPFANDSHLISANVYVLGKNSVTLIDTGPKLPGIFSLLEKQLTLAGINMASIERIIITHGHIDHFGLAVEIQKAAGHPVEFLIHAEDSWKSSRANFRARMWSREADDFMAMAGVPEKAVETAKNRFNFFKTMCDPLDSVSTIKEGDEIAGEGYHLKIIHTPGHTAGSCCVYESGHKILFSGDHIIQHITPNPLVELKRSQLKDASYQSLKAYRDSLDKLTGLDVQFVLPGHGGYIEGLPEIISSYKTHHHRRMNLLWRALKNAPRSLYDLIGDIFPYMPPNDVFLAISDIFAHLEILINEGRVIIIDPGPPALYQSRY
jgi:glyoxylase-like metal-dependent hydrolase (beta-lactamase superfamily II)